MEHTKPHRISIFLCLNSEIPSMLIISAPNARRKKTFLKVDEEETWLPAKSDGWRSFSFSLPQKGIPRRLTLEIRDSTESIQIAFIKSGDWDYNPFFVIGDKFHNYEACLNKD